MAEPTACRRPAPPAWTMKTGTDQHRVHARQARAGGCDRGRGVRQKRTNLCRCLPDGRRERLREHDVATSVAATLKCRSTRRRLEPKQHAEQAIPMRRRGLEPPPTKCGPGPQPGNPGVNVHASRSSRTSANLDEMDAMEDLDVATARPRNRTPGRPDARSSLSAVWGTDARRALNDQCWPQCRRRDSCGDGAVGWRGGAAGCGVVRRAPSVSCSSTSHSVCIVGARWASSSRCCSLSASSLREP